MIYTYIVYALLDALFPPRCQHCGSVGDVLCGACLSSLKTPALPLCPHCGRSLALPSGSIPQDCATCVSGRGPKALSGLRAAAVYEGIIREAVLALKYRGRRRLAEPLGDVLAANLKTALLDGTPIDLIIPVPLHTERRRTRGFNQAALLARRCGSRLGIPVADDVLVRTRATAPQVGLSLADRRTNIVDAFALTSPQAARRVAGRHVVLVDDVTTTGSTLDAAAAALMAAGPASVLGLAVARPDLGTYDSAQLPPQTLSMSAAVSSEVRAP